MINNQLEEVKQGEYYMELANLFMNSIPVVHTDIGFHTRCGIIFLLTSFLTY